MNQVHLRTVEDYPWPDCVSVCTERQVDLRTVAVQCAHWDLAVIHCFTNVDYAAIQSRVTLLADFLNCIAQIKVDKNPSRG
jgi:hypothetical protein